MLSRGTMKGVYLVEVGKFVVREIPIPQPGPREVLVAVKAIPGVAKYLEGRVLFIEVVVPGRLVSLVVK